MKEILKQAFDKANDIVTRFERNELSLREKVDGLNTLIEETETKVKKVSANSCVSGSYREQAMEWWENLEDNEVIEVYKKTGNFRLGGWGHDIEPTEDDVINMYKVVFNYR